LDIGYVIQRRFKKQIKRKENREATHVEKANTHINMEETNRKPAGK
jgi:hypothetical protein